MSNPWIKTKDELPPGGLIVVAHTWTGPHSEYCLCLMIYRSQEWCDIVDGEKRDPPIAWHDPGDPKKTKIF